MLKQISKILTSEKVDTLDRYLEELSTDDILYLKYAPITSVIVEYSFLAFKTLLAD